MQNTPEHVKPLYKLFDKLSWRDIEEQEVVTALQASTLDFKAPMPPHEDRGMQLLHLAIQCMAPKVTKILLEKGCDPNIRTESGDNTPLHCLLNHHGRDSYNGMNECLKLLLEFGADVNALNDKQKNPLMLLLKIAGHKNTDNNNAVINGAKILLAAGSDIQGEMGCKTLCAAINCREIVDYFLEKGISIDGCVNKNTAPAQTIPLLSAVARDNVEMFNYLLAKGATLNKPLASSCVIDALKGISFKWKFFDYLLTLPQVDLNCPSLEGELPLAVSILNVCHRGEILIAHGADFNRLSQHEQDMYHNSILIKNINDKNLAEVKRLLSTWNFNQSLSYSSSGYLPIHYTSKHGLASIIALLIEKGADVNAKTFNAEKLLSPLQILADSDDLNNDAVLTLVDSGADIDYINAEGKNVLCILSRRLNSNLVNDRGDETIPSPLFIEIAKALHFLIERGANVKGKLGVETLCNVLQYNYVDNIDIARLLLEKGVDYLPVDNLNPLRAAADIGAYSIVTALHQKGVDFKTHVVTVAYAALTRRLYENERLKIIELCVQQGLPAKTQHNNASLLYWAAKYGHTSIAKFLINQGADVNVGRDNGESPLSVVVDDHKNTDLVKLLLDNGADTATQGASYLYQALRDSKNSKTVRLLLEKNIDVNTPSKNEFPLQTSVKSKSVELTQLLLEKGADPNRCADNSNGELPLLTAVKQGNVEIAHLLLLHGADRNLLAQKNKTIAAVAQSSKKKGIPELFALSEDALKTFVPVQRGLRFLNQRLLLAEGIDAWQPKVLAQVHKLFGKKSFAAIQEENEGGEIELYDVADLESGKVLYQLYLFNYGDGALFAAGKTTYVGHVVQHGFEVASAMSEDNKAELHEKLAEACTLCENMIQSVDFSQ